MFFAMFQVLTWLICFSLDMGVSGVIWDPRCIIQSSHWTIWMHLRTGIHGDSGISFLRKLHLVLYSSWISDQYGTICFSTLQHVFVMFNPTWNDGATLTCICSYGLIWSTYQIEWRLLGNILSQTTGHRLSPTLKHCSSPAQALWTATSEA